MVRTDRMDTGDDANQYSYAFQPLRTRDGTPIELPKDPQEAQEYLRTLSVDDVFHNTRLLDLWREAKAGTLPEYLAKDRQAQAERSRSREVNPSAVDPQPSSTQQEAEQVGVDSATSAASYEHYKAVPSPTHKTTAQDRIRAKYVKDTFGDSLDRKQFDRAHSEVSKLDEKHEADPDSLSHVGDLAEMVETLRAEFASAQKSKSSDPSAIDAVMPAEPATKDNRTEGRKLLDATVPQDAAEQAKVSMPEDEEGQGSASNMGMEGLHMTLDAVGTFGDAVVPGSGVVADGANAAIYLGRAFSEPERRGEHLTNAGISAISMIPFLGDFAKLGKYGPRAAKGAREARALSKEEMAGRKATRGKWQGVGATVMGALGGLFGGSTSSGSAVESATKQGGSTASEGGGLIDSISGAIGGGGGGGSGNPPTGASGDSGDDDGKDNSMLPKPVNPEKTKASWNDYLARIGGVVAAYAMLLKTIDKFGDSVGKVTDETLKQNEALKNFNGQIAAAYSNLSIDRMRRQIELGQQMSGPLSSLADASSKREQAQQDWSTGYKKIGTDILTALNTMATHLVYFADLIDPLDEFFSQFSDWLHRNDKLNGNPITTRLANGMQDAIRQAKNEENELAKRQQDARNQRWGKN